MRLVIVCLVGFMGAVSSDCLIASPIAINDRSSFSRLQGLPTPLEARLLSYGQVSQAVQFELTSQFALDEEGSAFTLIDGETRELHGFLRYGLGRRFELSVDVPYLRQNGGSLDSFVQDWHEWFNLPNGGREKFPQNQLRYAVITDDYQFDYRESSDGVGDVGVALRYQLLDTPLQALATTLRFELPTGDFDTMTGSDSLDVAMGVDYDNGQLLSGLRTDIHASLGLVWFGDSHVLAAKSREYAGYASFSSDTRVWRDWRLRLQIQTHSAMFDLPTVPFSQPAILGALAVDVPLTSSLRLELGMTEDLLPKVTPDFTWFMAFKWQPSR